MELKSVNDFVAIFSLTVDDLIEMNIDLCNSINDPNEITPLLNNALFYLESCGQNFVEHNLEVSLKSESEDIIILSLRKISHKEIRERTSKIIGEKNCSFNRNETSDELTIVLLEFITLDALISFCDRIIKLDKKIENSSLYKLNGNYDLCILLNVSELEDDYFLGVLKEYSNFRLCGVDSMYHIREHYECVIQDNVIDKLAKLN